MLAIKLGGFSVNLGYVGMKNLLISNGADEVRALRETFKGYQVLGGEATSKLWLAEFDQGENSCAVLFSFEFISRWILQISEPLERPGRRKEKERPSESLPSMTGNRLKGIAVKICGMFYSAGVWDIPVAVTTHKPKMERVGKKSCWWHKWFWESRQCRRLTHCSNRHQPHTDTLNKKPLSPIVRSWHFLKLLGGFGTQVLTIQSAYKIKGF